MSPVARTLSPTSASGRVWAWRLVRNGVAFIALLALTVPALAANRKVPPWKLELDQRWSAEAEYERVKTESRLHYINDIWLAITNYGQIGAGRQWTDMGAPYEIPRPNDDLRQLKIGWVPSLEFPPRTENDYLLRSYAFFGCVRGADTLVSRDGALGPIVESSTSRRLRVYDPKARADQQYFVATADTTWLQRQRVDYWEGRHYIPIGLEIHMTSYAWSVEFAKRFIIFDCWFVNVSDQPIHKGCAGFYVWPHTINDALWMPIDHPTRGLVGTLRSAPGMVAGTTDTLNITWWADNDGDPVNYSHFQRQCPTGVIGIRVLRTPPGVRRSANWWTYISLSETSYEGWGPYQTINGNRYGRGAEPIRDREWYRLMTNGEIDYDQYYTALSFQDDGWGPPPQDLSQAKQLASGTHIQFVVSAGPFETIAPGDSVPFTFALIAGEGFHSEPRNHKLHFDALNPAPFVDRLDFSDLIANARWADWFFDIPGYDTDGDGNRGLAHLVNCGAHGCDSIFYKGDGVPDFSGPRPPSPPPFTLTSKPSKVILRWDGAIPETEFDVMSGQRDFEGYRVYAGKFNSDDQLSLISSWDKENFNRMIYDPQHEEWKTTSFPHSITEWQEIMGDASFDPSAYSVADMEHAFVDSSYDTITNSIGQVWIIPKARYSCWESQDDNRCNEYMEMGYREINLIQRVGERDTTIGDETITYGVYEVTIDNLNPSVPLHFAVTTFDFGNFQVNLEPLESSPSNNTQYGEPIYSSDVVVDSNLKVSVFPNPYKIQYDGVAGNRTTYYLEGYEGRGIHDFVEQDRRIHFINLPDTATIRIWSLDGDLIREIQHPDRFLTTYSSSVGWDLISRNTQAVVSGIYIWRVDSKLGSQVGKLVIIK